MITSETNTHLLAPLHPRLCLDLHRQPRPDWGPRPARVFPRPRGASFHWGQRPGLPVPRYPLRHLPGHGSEHHLGSLPVCPHCAASDRQPGPRHQHHVGPFLSRSHLPTPHVPAPRLALGTPATAPSIRQPLRHSGAALLFQQRGIKPKAPPKPISPHQRPQH